MEEEFYTRLKSFGYTKQYIKKCMVKISKKYGEKDIAINLNKELKKIEKDCIESFSATKPLKDYQKKVVKFMTTHRGVIAAFDVGMGKTLTAIATAECLRKQAEFFGQELRIIIITPKTLIENFKKEMIAVGIKPKEPYEFWKLQTFVNRFREGKVSCENTLVIIDEAHNLRTDYRGEFEYKVITKKEKTFNAQNVIKCVSKAWKVLLLTATPAYNKPHDIVNLVAMVRGDEIPMLASRFEKNLKDEASFRNAFGCVFAFKKVEDTTEYPERLDKFYYFVMPQKYLDTYEILEREYWEKTKKQMQHRKKKGIADDDEEITLTEKQEKAAKNRFMTDLRQATINLKNEKGKYFENPKVQKALEIVKTGEKTVIYSEFITHGIDALKKKLDEAGIKYLSITGDDSADVRAEAVRKFNRSKKLNVLLISKAGREGIDLVGVRNIVLVEKGWVKSGENQVIGRGIRYKSHTHLPEEERKVFVHHLILIKPTDKAYVKDEPPKGYHESADLYLHKYAMKKDEDTKIFIGKLEKEDIFNAKC